MRSTLLLLLAAFCMRAIAQQSMPVTDSLPAILDGLKAGYIITETSEKEVGKKGNFSRYKLRFYITNITSQAKILYQRSALFGDNGSTSNVIVRFTCANATGARFTNKQASLELQPCTLLADVEDKECTGGKVVVHHRPVNIGYWIKPGETISVNTIMITPLNEKPAMTAVYYPEPGAQAASLMGLPGRPQQAEGVVHIKNFSNNYYLKIENEQLICVQLDHEQLSTQWEILPVAGTNYYNIRNRLKFAFVSAVNNNLFLTDNGQNTAAMWLVEESSEAAGTYTIKNAATNAKLVMQNGMLKVTPIASGTGGQWIIE